MLHISQNYYLDVCPDCFVLQEKYITPELNAKGEPNTHAGQVNWVNQSFHPTHKDVVNKLMSVGLRQLIEGETKQAFDFMDEINKRLDDLLKVKRGHEPW